jgi:AcrR family transcriptional regulator
MSRRKVQLSRETIAATALAIADAEGFQAVSMRRVAQELNVGTMSLYYYVKTKDDLIAVMDDALMSEALLPSLPKNWKRAITEIATRTHSIFLRHPWALVSMQSAPPGLNAMRHMEQCLEALAEISITAKQKLTLLAMVDDFVFGHALREAASNTAVDLEFAAAQMATGNFPRIAEIFRDGRIETGKDRFQMGLRLLLEGIRSAAASPSSEPQTQLLKSSRGTRAVLDPRK